MLLDSVIDASLRPKLTVIQESKEARCIPLLKRFLKCASKHCQPVHMICFQQPPNFYNFILPPSGEIHLYDAFTDPIGWNSDATSSQHGLETYGVNADFLQVIREKCKQPHEVQNKAIVIFDGLNMLIKNKGIHHVCCLLNSFTIPSDNMDVVQVVAVAENELLTYFEINALEHMANAFVELMVKDTSMKSAGKIHRHPLKYTIDVTVKKTSGKVVREIGVYHCTKDFEIVKIKDLGLLKQVEDDDAEQSDPTANLPFNLRLTDSEREARSQVRLPYMLDQEQKAAQLDGPSSGGRIIYQPDDADDFDEEDPDDDLDI